MRLQTRYSSPRTSTIMRASSVALALVSLLGVTTIAAEKPTPEFQKAMKDLGAVAQIVAKPEAAEDFALITKQVPVSNAALAVVEKYFRGKTGAEEALKLAQAAVKTSADMGVAANLMSVEGVQASVKELFDTCKACHEAHREKQPDGTFLIK